MELILKRKMLIKRKLKRFKLSCMINYNINISDNNYILNNIIEYENNIINSINELNLTLVINYFFIEKNQNIKMFLINFFKKIITNNHKELKESTNFFENMNLVRLFSTLNDCYDINEYNDKIDIIYLVLYYKYKKIPKNYYYLFKLYFKYILDNGNININNLGNLLEIMFIFPISYFDNEIFSYLINILKFELTNKISELVLLKIKVFIKYKFFDNIDAEILKIKDNLENFGNYKDMEIFKIIIEIINLYFIKDNSKIDNDMLQIILNSKNNINIILNLIINKIKIKNTLKILIQNKYLFDILNDILLKNKTKYFDLVYNIFAIMLKNKKKFRSIFNFYKDVILILINKLYINSNTNFLKLIRILIKRDINVINEPDFKKFLKKNKNSKIIRNLNAIIKDNTKPELGLILTNN